MPRAAPCVVLAFVLTITAAQGQQYNVCTNTCNYAADSDCDDGGPGWNYDICGCGTDCSDCGTRPSCLNDVRVPPPPSPSPPPPCYAYGSNRCNANTTSTYARKGYSSYSSGSGGDDGPAPFVFIGPAIGASLILFACLRTHAQARRNQTTHFEVIRSFTRPKPRGQIMATPPQNVPQAIPQAVPDIQMAVPVGGVTVTEASPPLGQSNPTEELERLAALHASGMLNDAEFEQAKARVLGLGPGAGPVHMGQPVVVQPGFSLFGGGGAAVPMGQAV